MIVTPRSTRNASSRPTRAANWLSSTFERRINRNSAKEAVAHRIAVGIPSGIALIGLNFTTPGAGERLLILDGEAKPVAQEELSPLPQRAQCLHAVKDVVFVDHLLPHVGGDATPEDAYLDHAIQFPYGLLHVNRRHIAQACIIHKIEKTVLKRQAAHVAEHIAVLPFGPCTVVDVLAIFYSPGINAEFGKGLER